MCWLCNVRTLQFAEEQRFSGAGTSDVAGMAPAAGSADGDGRPEPSATTIGPSPQASDADRRETPPRRHRDA